MDFTSQVVLITGGSGLIGKNLAQAFYKLGAKVVINSRDPSSLTNTADSIDSGGSRILTFAGDVKDPKVAKDMVSFCKQEVGGLDILINNAGIYIEKPFLEHTEADFDEHLGCILKGSFFLAQASAHLMMEKGCGSIINIGSAWGIRPVHSTPTSAHSIAKAGLHMLTESLALELAPYKIRVNAVAPGAVTPNNLKQNYNELHPLGHNGSPGDILNAVLYLASQEASWITGSILKVDGGMMISR